MTVKELADRLSVVSGRQVVRLHRGWDDEPEVTDIAFNDDGVLLGHELPPERHETDYRYERP